MIVIIICHSAIWQDPDTSAVSIQIYFWIVDGLLYFFKRLSDLYIMQEFQPSRSSLLFFLPCTVLSITDVNRLLFLRVYSFRVVSFIICLIHIMIFFTFSIFPKHLHCLCYSFYLLLSLVFKSTFKSSILSLSFVFNCTMSLTHRLEDYTKHSTNRFLKYNMFIRLHKYLNFLLSAFFAITTVILIFCFLAFNSYSYFYYNFLFITMLSNLHYSLP